MSCLETNDYNKTGWRVIQYVPLHIGGAQNDRLKDYLAPQSYDTTQFGMFFDHLKMVDLNFKKEKTGIK